MAKFFSLEGQIERIKNVGATFKALLPKSLGGDDIKLINPKTGLVMADVTVPVKGAVLVAAVGPALASRGIPQAIAKNIGAKYAEATLPTQIGVGAGALIAAGAVARRPSETLTAAAELPSGLVNVGGNVADLISDPSIENAKKLVTENPFIVGATAATALIAGGVGAGAVANTLATTANTRAIKESTKAEPGLLKTKSESRADPVFSQAPLNTQPLTTVYPEKTSITASTKKRKSIKKALPSPIFRNIFKPQVIVLNRNG